MGKGEDVLGTVLVVLLLLVGLTLTVPLAIRDWSFVWEWWVG